MQLECEPGAHTVQRLLPSQLTPRALRLRDTLKPSNIVQLRLDTVEHDLVSGDIVTCRTLNTFSS